MTSGVTSSKCGPSYKSYTFHQLFQEVAVDLEVVVAYPQGEPLLLPWLRVQSLRLYLVAELQHCSFSATHSFGSTLLLDSAALARL
jgi:hypothetical protein